MPPKKIFICALTNSASLAGEYLLIQGHPHKDAQRGNLARGRSSLIEPAQARPALDSPDASTPAHTTGADAGLADSAAR